MMVVISSLSRLIPDLVVEDQVSEESLQEGVCMHYHVSNKVKGYVIQSNGKCGFTSMVNGRNSMVFKERIHGGALYCVWNDLHGSLVLGVILKLQWVGNPSFISHHECMTRHSSAIIPVRTSQVSSVLS
ncbi:hypothetical protein LR48_Vigan457s000400 [Vigna angularis]|uniref:Uncharacterized protein n=1 Tax=Phaseolus angularis TaxID=3914 RepID=A0A0L9TBF7_PHAAN|nr:hypothetical protein LR48_Vigan457s000400 [Vigna angularis]